MRQALIHVLVEIALLALQGFNQVLLLFDPTAQFSVLAAQRIDLQIQLGDLGNPPLKAFEALVRSRRFRRQQHDQGTGDRD